MVAFTVAAIALGALYAGVTTGLRGTVESARQLRAIAIARSRLAVLDTAGTTPPAAVDGEEPGGYRWRLSATPVAAASAGGVATAHPLLLYDIRVSVSWPGAIGSTRSLTINTRRAIPPADDRHVR